MYIYLKYIKSTQGYFPFVCPYCPRNPKTSNRPIIWTFWHDYNLPKPVKLAIDSWKHYNPEYDICIITKYNIDQYIRTDELPPTFDKQIIQRKADIIRIILLYKYGGVWADSTFFMCKPLKLFPPEKPYDISGYYIEKFTTNPKYTIFENWFFVAQKNNLLIKLWKDELFKCLSFEDDNAYVESVLNDGVDLQGIPKKLQAYLSIHVAFQVVLPRCQTV